MKSIIVMKAIIILMAVIALAMTHDVRFYRRNETYPHRNRTKPTHKNLTKEEFVDELNKTLNGTVVKRNWTTDEFFGEDRWVDRFIGKRFPNWRPVNERNWTYLRKRNYTRPSPPFWNRTRHDGSRTRYDWNRTRPDSNRTRPDWNITRPDSTRTRPDWNRTRPDWNRTRPDWNRTQPDWNRTRPDWNRTQPDWNRTRPDGNRTQPDWNRTRPDWNRTQSIPPKPCFNKTWERRNWTVDEFMGKRNHTRPEWNHTRPEWNKTRPEWNKTRPEWNQTQIEEKLNKTFNGTYQRKKWTAGDFFGPKDDWMKRFIKNDEDSNGLGYRNWTLNEFFPEDNRVRRYMEKRNKTKRNPGNDANGWVKRNWTFDEFFPEDDWTRPFLRKKNKTANGWVKRNWTLDEFFPEDDWTRRFLERKRNRTSVNRNWTLY